MRISQNISIFYINYRISFLYLETNIDHYNVLTFKKYFQGQIDGLKSETEKIKTEKTSMETTQAKTKEENAALTEKVNKLEADVKNLQNEKEALTKEKDNLKSEMVNQSSTSDRLQQLEAENNKLKVIILLVEQLLFN